MFEQSVERFKTGQALMPFRYSIRPDTTAAICEPWTDELHLDDAVLNSALTLPLRCLFSAWHAFWNVERKNGAAHISTSTQDL